MVQGQISGSDGIRDVPQGPARRVGRPLKSVQQRNSQNIKGYIWSDDENGATDEAFGATHMTSLPKGASFSSRAMLPHWPKLLRPLSSHSHMRILLFLHPIIRNFDYGFLAGKTLVNGPLAFR